MEEFNISNDFPEKIRQRDDHGMLNKRQYFGESRHCFQL